MKRPQHIGRGVFGMIALVTLATTGCWGGGDNLPREPISGTVTFDNSPLKGGSIQFLPEQSAGGISSGGVITDGRFQVAKADGPIPGKYKVMIFAEGGRGAMKRADEAPGRPEPAAMGPAGLIPLRYNFQTELTADVKAGGPNDFTYDLRK
jgi:hypothetical protein